MAIAMRALAGLLGLFHGVNGARMIVAPALWYGATPGVDLAGPYNPHFVVDIGFIFLISGAGFLFWAIRPAEARQILAMAAAWPAAHAGFHMVHLDHLPTTGLLMLELAAVILPGALGGALVVLACRMESPRKI